MRLILYVLMCFSLVMAKDRNYKLYSGQTVFQILECFGMLWNALE